MTASPEIASAATRTSSGRPRWQTAALLSLGALLLLAFVRLITGAPDLTSSGTAASALRLAVPIGLAGLGGLYAERTGVVNIGLEGMMVLGTWFGGWAGFEYGVWVGVLFGLLGGAAGGLLHAVATVTFGVDHIVSGVAINILAAGITRFLSVIVLSDLPGGGATQSPSVSGDVGQFTMPVLAGGYGTWDWLGTLELTRWFLVADAAGLLRGLMTNVSWLTIIAVALIPFTWWFLWRTPLGLRMRSVGENPYAAESLGVRVYTMKYIGVTISGALAGLAGAFLVIEAAGIYREGQTAGRGFIGLAAMIFGNWRPLGTGAGAALFGFASALELRSDDAVHGLVLGLAVALLVAGLAYLLRRRMQGPAARPARSRLGVSGAFLVLGVGFLTAFLTTDSVPSQIVFITPYVVTLVVLAFASQRLRMPAADGLQYRKGEAG